MLDSLNSLSSSFLNNGFRRSTSGFPSSSPASGSAQGQLRIGNYDAFQAFNSILQNAYQRIVDASRPTQLQSFGPDVEQPKLANNNLANNSQTITPIDTGDRITADQAAGTILDFIGQRLRSDFANGAGKEELLARLDEGRRGFLQGFAEAKEQIAALGLLTADLEEEITDTYNQVLAGIDNFADRINSKFSNERLDQESTQISQVNRFELQTQSSQQNSFALSLTTQDGDIVTINISRFQQQSLSAQVSNTGSSGSNKDGAPGNSGTSIQVSGSRSFSSNFSLSVQGELDEEELASINALLEDVNAIATDFYAGDLDSAFELAQQLEIDREELASLNLQLQQTRVSQAYVAYESVAPEIANLPSIDLEPLINQVESLLQSAREFAKPVDLLRDAFTAVEALQEQSQQRPELFDNVASLIEKFDL